MLVEGRALRASFPPPDKVSSHYPNWSSLDSVLKLPVWASLIVSLGTIVTELEFLGSPGSHQCHPPCSGSVLSSGMGSGRQLQLGLETPCGKWMRICGWAGMHRRSLCSHLPTTISLTKSPFFLSPFAGKKLLSL